MVVRLAVGAVSRGSDEVVRRLRTIPQETGREKRKPGPVDVAAGLAVEAAEIIGRAVSTVAREGSLRQAEASSALYQW